MTAAMPGIAQYSSKWRLLFQSRIPTTSPGPAPRPRSTLTAGSRRRDMMQRTFRMHSR
jgi:hypothetical protein